MFQKISFWKEIFFILTITKAIFIMYILILNAVAVWFGGLSLCLYVDFDDLWRNCSYFSPCIFWCVWCNLTIAFTKISQSICWPSLCVMWSQSFNSFTSVYLSAGLQHILICIYLYNHFFLVMLYVLWDAMQLLVVICKRNLKCYTIC